MDDWNGMPFLILWGVLASGLGCVFAFSPEVVESEYRKRINYTPFTRRLGERYAPREWVLKLYRVGGFIFLGVGIIAFVTGVVGTIGFAIGAFA